MCEKNKTLSGGIFNKKKYLRKPSCSNKMAGNNKIHTAKNCVVKLAPFVYQDKKEMHFLH